MNRRDRRAAGQWTKQQEVRIVGHARQNAHRWSEIKRIKRDFDRLEPHEQAEQKPILAAVIDQHLAALTAE